HPFADLWRRRRSPLRAIVPFWMLIITSLAAATWQWHSIQLYSSPWAWIPALGLFGAAISVYRRMPSQFGVANFSGHAELNVQSERRLVTTGMHARVRHPIYLAHLCTLLAFKIGSGLLVDYGLLVFALVTGAVMILLEECELERRFGDDWREYRSRTGAILPSLRRASAGANANLAPEVKAR
ncbi:MAG TPA: isoprenylcysteine carboxylmethyltransferase family protein, partial [Terriglobales bacterium]|nr:isoprenylcysteine carboxylmethyltransferase family protein [Terriglobales bacterium]